MISTNVTAEWKQVTETNDFIIYTDFQSIRKKGSKVKIWQLWDYKTLQPLNNTKTLSSILHKEYNCQEDSSRTVDLRFYSGNMATGIVVYSQNNMNEQFIAIEPNSYEKVELEYMCDKK
jgi:hypothetical protein